MQIIPSLADRIEDEQIRGVLLQLPVSMWGPAALAAVLALQYWQIVPRTRLLIVVALVYVMVLWFLLFYRRYSRALVTALNFRPWARANMIAMAIQGCCWGALSFAIFIPGSIPHQSFNIAVMFSLSFGAIIAAGPHFPSFLLFIAPIMGTPIISCLSEGSRESIGLGMAGVVGLTYVLLAARNAHRVATKAILTRFENLDLVRELEQKKAAAERAQAQAEAANVAKSRFLAAASHDLRQPVHALGLFVSAARQTKDEVERARIVEHIATSVESLATLFDSLLDVSRLDAGVLQPQPQTIALAPFLQRIAEEYREQARAKALKLRVRSEHLLIRTDPALFEQLLRNLVSNALRYTTSGGILVCGRRRGVTALIEVWDTGIGIAPAQHELVFEEFFQVGNPERDRRNGVGLGLAIVKRIAALLNHPLQLTSRPDQGSRVRVVVAVAAQAFDADSAPPVLAADQIVLLGVVVVVIDDEIEILTAIDLLLRQWGCISVTAESAAAALDSLRVRGAVPDMIVSDYRLRDGNTGIEAIRALRAAFSADLPGLLLTGDTAAERLREVSSSGFEVLHKPVSAEQLNRALRRMLA